MTAAPTTSGVGAPGPRPGPGVRSAIVVGGGIAGVAAALRLAEEGVAVTLFETRKKLGGRATSFTDTRTGLTLDNCQHVALGCCTNYLDLCGRLGVGDRLRWTRELNWIEAGGRVSVIRTSSLPAPGHMGPSFLTAAFLTWREKSAIALAMLAAVREDRRQWRDRVFAEWLRENRQPESAVRKFWSPVMVSACNLDVDRVCASSALHVFQEGFLAHHDAAAVSVAGVPLVELYDPAEGAIRAAGGAVRLGVSVDRVSERSVTTASGETLEADAVVCAVPPERAARIVDGGIRRRDDRFARLADITHSPILGVHLAFDRPVLGLPHAVLVDRPTQWIFRKDDAGARIHAVISAADAWIPLSEDEIAQRVLADLHACLPASREAQLTSVRAVKEKLATFAPTPEVERIRPATTGATRLILAGDYVQTGWPATMEGATRSGYLAAAAVVGKDEAWALRPGLRASVVYRALSAGG